jgi:hypothetical protein
MVGLEEYPREHIGKLVRYDVTVISIDGRVTINGL